MVSSLARWLGIAPLLRRAYHRWAVPNDIFTVQLADFSITLYAKTGKELLQHEGALVTERGWSERPLLEAFLSFLRPGDVAYDVGASLGLYSVALGRRVGERGRVIAFEPVRGNFECLRANIGLNHLQNVSCFQMALGERDAKADIYTDPEQPWCSTLIERAGGASGRSGRVESVDIVEGDSSRFKQGLPIPRALKIDVEGFEYAVIRGLRRTLSDPACRFLGCEIHPCWLPTGITPERIMEMLQGLGFSRMQVSSRGREQQFSCYKE
jgi:FkbM family methyltransferase